MAMFAITPYILTDPPAPGSEEWARTITASKVPPMIRDADGNFAGFGYITAWEQYQELKGEVVDDPNDFMLKRFKAALAIEQKAAEWWIAQQDNPDEWELSDGEVAYHNPLYPFFGFATVDRVATNTRTGEQVILEIKNPDVGGVKPGWVVQHLAQQETSGITTGGLIIWPRIGEPEWHPIAHDQAKIDAIMADVAAFAERLDNNDEPAGGNIQLTQDDMDDLAEAQKLLDDAEKNLAAIKQSIIDKLGDHKRATFDGKVILTSQAGKFAASRIPKEHQALTKSDKFMTTSKKFDAKKFAAEYPDLYADAIGATTYKWL